MYFDSKLESNFESRIKQLIISMSNVIFSFNLILTENSTNLPKICHLSLVW